MFLIVVPTIRKDIRSFRWALHESLTCKTDIIFIHGDEGIAASYNRSLGFLDPARHAYFAKIDDDILLPPGWQDDCVRAIETAGLAAVGLDLSHTEDGRRYVVEVNDWREVPSDPPVRFRPVNSNIAGILICTRARTALEVGRYPWDGKTKYEFDEDGWRCKRMKEMGGKLGYVETRQGRAEIIQYDDPPEYIARKHADVDYIRNTRGIAK